MEIKKVDVINGDERIKECKTLDEAFELIKRLVTITELQSYRIYIYKKR